MKSPPSSNLKMNIKIPTSVSSIDALYQGQEGTVPMNMVTTPDVYGFAPGMQTAGMESVYSQSSTNSISRKMKSPNSKENVVRVANNGGIPDLDVLEILTSAGNDNVEAQDEDIFLD